MFVKPLIQKDDALKRLNKRSRLSFRRRNPEPEKIELIYFPYYLFKISIIDRKKKREISVASDGLLGDFAFLEIANLNFIDKTNVPHFNFRIEVEKAKNKVLDEYQWLLVKFGFHRRHPPTMEGITDINKFYYPYWVAYYKKRDGYDFKVIDGIACAPIGIRMRRSFLTAFSQNRALQ